MRLNREKLDVIIFFIIFGFAFKKARAIPLSMNQTLCWCSKSVQENSTNLFPKFLNCPNDYYLDIKTSIIFFDADFFDNCKTYLQSSYLNAVSQFKTTCNSQNICYLDELLQNVIGDKNTCLHVELSYLCKRDFQTDISRIILLFAQMLVLVFVLLILLTVSKKLREKASVSESSSNIDSLTTCTTTSHSDHLQEPPSYDQIMRNASNQLVLAPPSYSSFMDENNQYPKHLNILNT